MDVTEKIVQMQAVLSLFCQTREDINSFENKELLSVTLLVKKNLFRKDTKA